MPISVYIVHRVSLAIGVGIKPSPAKRAECIRAVKAHQPGVMHTPAVTKQITAQ
ncbi:hypothetical protein D3C76_1456580 [compost metagenome]